MNSVTGSNVTGNYGHTDGPGFPVKAMVEIWEMNIHVNPMDDETRDKIIENKLSLSRDPYVDFVRHKENARKRGIYMGVFQDKLKDFNREEYPKGGVDFKQIQNQDLDANLDENITDLSNFVKISKPRVDQNNRFECILSKYTMKQNKIKREYLKRLPRYIEDEIIKKNSREPIEPIALADFDPKIKQRKLSTLLF